MALSYERYTLKVATYLRRVMMSNSQEEARFFAHELEAFMDRNKDVVALETDIRNFEMIQRQRLDLSGMTEEQIRDFKGKPLSPEELASAFRGRKFATGGFVHRDPNVRMTIRDTTAPHSKIPNAQDRRWLDQLKVRW